MSDIRVYAIRSGDYIELRVSDGPIEAIKSKLTRITTSKQAFFEPERNKEGIITRYKQITKDLPKKTILEQTSYVGGEVLGYIRYLSFNRSLTLKVMKDQVIILPKADMEKVLTKAWQRRHL